MDNMYNIYIYKYIYNIYSYIYTYISHVHRVQLVSRNAFLDGCGSFKQRVRVSGLTLQGGASPSKMVDFPMIFPWFYGMILASKMGWFFPLFYGMFFPIWSVFSIQIWLRVKTLSKVRHVPGWGPWWGSRRSFPSSYGCATDWAEDSDLTLVENMVDFRLNFWGHCLGTKVVSLIIDVDSD